MGAPWDRNVTSWSRGEYAEANNPFEDDLDVIAYQFSRLNDEVGDQFGTAQLLQPNTAGEVHHQGRIESRLDSDLFKIELPTSSQLDIQVYPTTNALYGLYFPDWRSPLKLQMQIYNEAGILILSNQVPNRLHVDTTMTLDAGLYYIRFDGVGSGDPMGSFPTGFSDYGSVGAFYMSGTITTSDDVDEDTLPDAWEIEQFGSLFVGPRRIPMGMVAIISLNILPVATQMILPLFSLLPVFW